jgi:glycerol-3-phosphate dehydrogenase
VITRDPLSAAQQSYDLIVVGGGIYGTMIALESARRGLRPLVLERGDFGGATSYNSLRILHGGLRYLQHCDLRRFRASVKDRQWFLQNFPDLVRPLPCIMPLYDRGMRRRSLFRFALLTNDLLSNQRNKNVPPESWIPRGHLISAKRTQEIFPLVDGSGLRGGAVWYDAWMPESHRVLIETLRWAGDLGATALNYVEALRLRQASGKVVAVEAVDHNTGETYEFRTRVVVNATGPWCSETARKFDRGESVALHHSLAWNILFDRPALSGHAAAVTPKGPGGQTYFLLPWKGKLLAGTGHAPSHDDPERPSPPESCLTRFIEDLNAAVPGLNLSGNEMLSIFAGLLPAVGPDSTNLSPREVIFDHGAQGGVEGLYSVSGVKFTTSRSVAQKIVDRLFPHRRGGEIASPRIPVTGAGVYDQRGVPGRDDTRWGGPLRRLITEEAVCHLDDLVLRRATLSDNPQEISELAPLLCDLFPWDEKRRTAELERLENALRHPSANIWV